MRGAFLRRCDPRVKVVLAVVFAALLATSRSWEVLPWAALLVAAWQLLSGEGVVGTARRLLPANVFLLFVLLTFPFTTPGEPLFSLLGLEASREGCLLAGFLFLKSNLILWGTVLLLGTSSVFSLAHALHHLHLPGKLVQLLFFTFRYLELLEREFHRLWEAARLRCFVPRTDLHTYRTLAYLVASLLVRSYDRSRRVYEAMLCRGFAGYFPVFRHFSLSRADVVFALSCGAAFLWLAYRAHLG